jgi:hypothetical protein
MAKKTTKKKTAPKKPKKTPARPDVNQRAKGMFDEIASRTENR